MGTGAAMSARQRLDALARVLGNLPTVGEACSACGYPQRMKRIPFAVFVSHDVGRCPKCDRHLDLKDDARPVESEHLTVIVRGTPPSGWAPDPK